MALRSIDLMIGDWVKFSDSSDWTEGLQGVPVQVKGLRDDDGAIKVYDPRPDKGYSDIWSDYEEDFEPIPLTPEILEKNGFKFDGSGQRSMMFLSKPQFAEGLRFNIYVGLKRKTIEVFAAHPIEKSPNWRKSNKVSLEVCGCYVHELQHALRLCGIEKEIEL